MAGKSISIKNSSHPIGNRTRDLPACSAVPQPTAPPLTPLLPQQDVFCFEVHCENHYSSRNISYDHHGRFAKKRAGYLCNIFPKNKEQISLVSNRLCANTRGSYFSFYALCFKFQNTFSRAYKFPWTDDGSKGTPSLIEDNTTPHNTAQHI